jgi:carbamoyl-phosphate synthase large subunit
MSAKIPVCVTGVGGGGVGEQIIKALLLADTPYYIVGTDTNAYSAGFFLVDYPAVLPHASQSDYIPRLLEVCKKRHVKAIFPGSELELKILSAHRELIANEGIVLFVNSQKVIDACLDKLATFAQLDGLGFNVPTFKCVESLEDIELLSYPQVFKPAVGGGGSVDTLIIQNAEEALLFCQYLLNIYPKFIAQEYIGSAETEYTACVLSDLDGNFINSIVLHRDLSSALSRRIRVPNRTSRKDLGENLIISSGISQGKIGSYPVVAGSCKEIARTLDSRGPLNIQCRVMNEKVWVFEINPRFSGTTTMRAMVGFNEPDILVRKHLLDQDITQGFEYKYGVFKRRLTECLCEESTASIS